MTVVATIHIGHRIITEAATFEVVGNLKMRGRYLYKVRNTQTGRINSIEREDLLEAQRDGSAKVVQ